MLKVKFKSNIESAFANHYFLYYSPHQGAKNLIRTVFPAVSASKLSGVSSMALAVAARPSSASVIFMVISSLCRLYVRLLFLFVRLWWLANLARYSWNILPFYVLNFLSYV